MTTESDGSGFGWYLGAFALGAMTGIAVALLTAPGTGRETRERLKNVARDVQSKAGRISGSLRGATVEAVKGGEEAFEQVRKEVVS